MRTIKTLHRWIKAFSLGGLCFAVTACSSSSSDGTAGGGSDGGGAAGAGATNAGGSNVGGSTSGGGTSPGGAGSGGTSRGGGGAGNGGASGGRGGAGNGGASGAGGSNAGGASGGNMGAGGNPSTGGNGWLYTKKNAIYVTGNDAAPWVGRGVNVDDIFFCGYDNTLWMQDPGATMKTMIAGLVSGWKPTFLRLSLSMATSTLHTSWLENPAQYHDPMVDVIKAIGTYPNLYVLVSLRSDDSMILQDQQHGDPEATGIPSDATTSPDKTKYPTGTDAVYAKLVDDFSDAPYVLFGLTNEAGGNLQSDATIAAAMAHAVSTIRNEEDRLGTPHHIVSVQGNSWTSNIGYYVQNPIQSDNVVYEVHGYPPATQSYTYDSLPVIIGEYGSLSGNSDAFFTDIESKNIPSLAWDFDPYSNCAPDLVNVDQSPTNLTPTDWGNVVKPYLAKHAP